MSTFSKSQHATPKKEKKEKKREGHRLTRLSDLHQNSWTFNFEEDPYSEIDILEGNGTPTQNANTVSLHTCGSCSFPSLEGPDLRQDCDLHAGANCDGGNNPCVFFLFLSSFPLFPASEISCQI